MIRVLLMGLVFWVLTLIFPGIDIHGFWTIIGSVVLFAVFNLVYHVTLGILLIPLRIMTLDIVSWFANIGIVYILASIFNKFTIDPSSFWQVLLFTAVFIFFTPRN